MHQKIGLFAAFTALAAGPAFAQRDFSEVEIKMTEIGSGVFVLEGAGGNIGLSIGDDGAFLIDDQFAPLSDKILAAVRTETDKPLDFLVNTHFHGDHSGGNEPLHAAGATIVAHKSVRSRLAAGSEIEGREAPPAPAGALPAITFDDSLTFYRNGQEIHVFHLSAAHTDGDAVVHFRTANVIHTGDLFFNTGYPFIDLEGGGDFNGYIAAQEAILAIADAETIIIPGHGGLASKADLERANRMLKDVRARVQALIEQGLDEDAVVRAEPLRDLDDVWVWRFIDGERMTRTAYRSLTREQTK